MERLHGAKVVQMSVTSAASGGTASGLAAWASALNPSPDDLELARRSLRDTIAVAMAARDDAQARVARHLGAGGSLAVLAHLLDYDDVHLESTSHVSAVCVPAALAAEGGARAYLAGAGVLVRLGCMLGWSHYGAGWHATCTAGAPAAAVAAAVAIGLDSDGVERAMALAVPAAGGVQAAFGTLAKSLQVGFAVDAGVRAARLAADGASAAPEALDQWLRVVGGQPADIVAEPSVPGDLAVKAYPCCYALHRPIEAMLDALGGERLSVDRVDAIRVRLPEDAIRPLLYSRPTTGLQGKFSLEYAVAATALDGRPGLATFTDAAVGRADARALVDRVTVEVMPGGGGLLAGTVEVEVRLRDDGVLGACVEVPSGAPGRPLSAEAFDAKVRDCAGRHAADVRALDWDGTGSAVNELFEVTVAA